jgi:DNA-directed RNA polymerase subunit M/transcription elongation factor TFIIS
MRNLVASTGTAHRPTRDTRKSKEYQNLRRENQHLSREVARLRKGLVKATETKQAFETEDEPTLPASESTADAEVCPKCPKGEAPHMREVDSPVGTIFVCPDCMHRFVRRAA